MKLNSSLKKIKLGFSLALIFFILTCGVLVYFFNRDLSILENRISGSSQTIPSTFGQIEFATIGSGEAILISHGSGGGFDQGLSMTAAAAAAEGFRLIVPSRFGYLNSPSPEGANAAIQADAYAELLDNLGIQKVSVLGISAGAWSALQFAARHPKRCRSLILLVPANSLPPGVPNFGGPIIRMIFASDFLMWLSAKMMSFAPSVVGPMMFGVPAQVISEASESEQLRLKALFLGLLPTTKRKIGMALDMAEAQSPTPCKIEEIVAPIIAISAADDQFATNIRAQEIVNKVKNGKIKIYLNGGHALVGRQKEVIQDIVMFLKSF